MAFQFGTINHQYTNRLHSMVDGLKLSKSIDETPCWLAAKQSCLSFKGERTRASRPIELIHSDICAAINPPPWNGKNMSLLL